MAEPISIPIRVETASASSPAAPNALPILAELRAALEQLAELGATYVLDLRRIPLSSQDFVVLRQTLGEGEVSATIDALGPTLIRETAVPGIWWVTHRNTEREIIGEFIEVTDVPALLRRPPEDIRQGAALLMARMANPQV